MSSAMGALKAATAVHHERLERRVDIERALTTRDGYRALLERFYGFYRPLEDVLAPVTIPGFDYARKLPLIEADLRTLDSTPDTLPLARKVPSVTTVGEALGVAYVIEGSALGGALIGTLVRRNLGIDSAFFAGGPGLAPRWRAFGEVVERHAPVSTTAAIATFEEMERWLCGDARREARVAASTRPEGSHSRLGEGPNV
ncbi:biliverdin-producing heme oxygenase [Solirubrobacter phytolaccae]|uniref:Biliverdin-producing heme oxygenase n=1 Tax=Solirubrobacter phytolaccae TaxID=1404360 RepID=A0A9X3N9S5_9ACTN|nr:biliverdin-producing heme oxygenase [Solirubrobacter phytolaccae]MDA0178722.1 biliverdin-producing heme oxygenase [Solirubrobacter phytolaccae]